MKGLRGSLPTAVLLLLLLATAVLPWLAMADSRTRGLTVNTMILAGLTILIALPTGTLLALLVVRTDMPGRSVAGWLMAALLFVPLYLQAAGWDAGFGRQGWYTLIADVLDHPPLVGWRAAVWIHSLAAIPWVFLIVGVGVRFVEPQLEEQALLDATPARVFLTVTLPRAASSMVAAALWIMVSVSGEMTVTDMFQVRTFAEELYLQFAQRGTLPAIGLSLLPGIALVGSMAAASLVLAGWIAPAGGELAVRPPIRFRLGWARLPAAVLVGLLILLILGLPLGSLVFKAGLQVELVDGERLRSWSAWKSAAVTVESPWRFRENHFWTMTISFWSATLALFIAIPLGWFARRSGWRAALVLVLAAIGMALPGPLVGMALVKLRGVMSWPVWLWIFDKTLVVPVIGLALRGLPLATLVAWYGARGIPDEVLQSAKTEGAGAASRLLWIVIPQRMAAWSLAWLVAFVLASGDLPTAILVVPPGVMTMSIRVFDFLHSGVDDQVAGICLSTILGYLGLALLGTTLVRIWRQS